jgi:hypothetical protein
MPESASSLRFAERAKLIKNLVAKRMDPFSLKIAALIDENRQLRARVLLLENYVTKLGGTLPPASSIIPVCTDPHRPHRPPPTDGPEG